MSGAALKQKVTKLEAARRQLSTAIELWFHDKDVVSVHTLAHASYEIVHVISKKKNRKYDLIFDSMVVKDEHRSEFNKKIKKYAEFFKHADRDAEATIEFPPQASEFFMMYSIMGLETIEETKTDMESAFVWWFFLQNPHFLTDNGRKLLANNIPLEHIEETRRAKKSDFLHAFINARNRLKVRK